MASFKDPALERALIEHLDDAEPRALIERFAALTRESGSDDERAAGEYIVERLRSFGLEPHVYEPSLYLSIPDRAELHANRAPVRCRPPSFARSTNGQRVEAEVVYVPSEFASGTATLFDTPGAALAAAGDDPVPGRIVLTEGYSMPGTVHAFERRGAVAQIYIHPGDAIHEGICTPIWGAPTHETIVRKPRTPVVCVNKPDGERLIRAAANGGLHASMATWLREGWFRCLLPVVEIHGTQDPDEFLLIHGHYDSWYVGIGDNATGNAALLELARVLHKCRSDLKRSVRIAWWPGHSTGRYAGSTWYADTFAADLDEWCIAQLDIDSPGCTGATAYEEVMWMSEAAELCIDAIADAVGEPAKGMRPLRAGDYSFNQIGPTGLYMLLSNIPKAERAARGYYAVGGCGGSPVWHTPEDGPAGADLSILRRDLQIYVTTVARALNAPLHPFDYTAAVLEIGAAVQRYQAAAGNEFDLRGVSQDLGRLRRAISGWRSDAETSVARHPGDHDLRRRLNATQRRLARVLVPLGYARGERFDHDPAIKFSAVPRLEAALHLAEASEAMKPFVLTALVRERNKIAAAVREALRLVT